MKNSKLYGILAAGMSKPTSKIEITPKPNVKKDLEFLRKLNNKRMGHRWHGGCFVRVGYLNEHDSINKIKKTALKYGFNSTLYVYRTKQSFIDSPYGHEIVIGIKDKNAEINIINGDINIKDIQCEVMTVSNANFRMGHGSIFIDNGSTGIKVKRSKYEDEYTDICKYLCLKYQHNLSKMFPDIVAKSFGIIKVKSSNDMSGICVASNEVEAPIKEKSMSKVNDYLKSPRYALVQEKVDIITNRKNIRRKRKVDQLIKDGLSNIFICRNRDPKPHSFGYNKDGNAVLFDIDQFITKLNVVEV